MKNVPLLRIDRETFKKMIMSPCEAISWCSVRGDILGKALVYKWLSNMTDNAQAINKGGEFEVCCNAMYNFTIQ